MLAFIFIAFVVTMAAVIVSLAAHYLGRRAMFGLAIGLSVWFICGGLMGYLGVIRNAAIRPPGIAYIGGPVLIFLAFFVFHISTSAQLAMTFPLWIILATQSFRIIVELFLNQLWIAGIVPKMLTFEGANVDIYIGATAPVIAWVSTRGQIGLRLALVWNILGLLALANVVVRSVLTTPGALNRIHAEVPNLMMGTFPFLFIPAFFVPLAVALHALAMRTIYNQLKIGEKSPGEAGG